MENQVHHKMTITEIILTVLMVLVILAIVVFASVSCTAGLKEKYHRADFDEVFSVATDTVHEAVSIDMDVSTINGNEKAGLNFRRKIVASASAEGFITGFHVSNASNSGRYSKEPISSQPPVGEVVDFLDFGEIEYVEFVNTHGDRWIYRALMEGNYSYSIEKADAITDNPLWAVAAG